MKIIPAIDIIGGQCVRLTKGAYNTKKVYSSNPLEVAKMFADKGFRYLHLVDLDGAKQGTPVNLSILESIASKTNLEIDYGGGLRTELSVSMAFDAGASAVTAGSVAVKNPTEVCSWLGRWGSSRIIIGAYDENGNIKNIGTIHSGISDEMKKDMTENPQNYLHKVCLVQCMEMDKKAKTIRHGFFKSIREDKNKEECLINDIFG